MASIDQIAAERAAMLPPAGMPLPAQQIADSQDDQAKFEITHYWADMTGDDLGSAVMDKVQAVQDFLVGNGFPQKWQKSQRFYYGQNWNIGWDRVPGIKEMGPQAQFKFINMNHFRALLKSILSIQTVNPPTPRCVPVNSDAASQQDAAFFQAILDYWVKKDEMLDKFVSVGESAAILDAGYMMIEWMPDPTNGLTGPDAEGFWTGQMTETPISAWDMFFDGINKSTWRQVKWMCPRVWMPKVEVAHRFKQSKPELYEQIMKMPGGYNNMNTFDTYRYDLFQSMKFNQFNDDIQVFKFFHERTPWMPDGKYCVFLEDGTCLYEGVLPYEQIPIERFALDEDMSGLYGFSPANSLIAPQEGVNILESAIITNLSNFATQYIATIRGTGFNPEMSKDGLAVIEVPNKDSMPTGLNLTAMPAGAFEHLQNTVNTMNNLVGVSLPSRGITPGPEFSGKASQILINQTTQNQGATSSRYADFQGKVYTQMMRVQKRYARNTKTIEIVGKHTSGTEMWLNESLSNFDRVICEPGNPALATPEGRTNFLLQLLQYGQGQITPQKVASMALNNNWQDAIEGARDNDIWIQKENELLMRAQQVLVYATDNHPKHIEEHKHILDNADYRLATQETDPAKFQAFQMALQHIFEHSQFLQAGIPGQPQASPQPQGQRQPQQPAAQ